MPPVRFTVRDEDAGRRLDRYLAEKLPEAGRIRIQEWIRQGRVLVDLQPARPALKLRGGQLIAVDPAPRAPLRAFPEDLPLDILYEDADVAAVNKPAGMSVHAGAGEASRAGTLVNALLHHFGQLSEAGGELRPGIVHRLDRFTSGVILAAKTDRAHRALARQFERRQVRKSYLAIVHGRVDRPAAERAPRKGRVVHQDGAAWVRLEAPLGRDRRRRARFAVLSAGRPAITDYRPLSSRSDYSLLEVRIQTGRTHQIRVHLAWAGYPVVGDRLYGAPAAPAGLPPLERFFLHAAELRLRHPTSGEPWRVAAPPPAEFQALLEALEL